MMQKVEERETIWTFRVVDKIAQRTQITLEENTCYWARQLKTWFYGYKTPNPIKGIIWGAQVDLDLKIAPSGTPTEALPAIPKADFNTKSLSTDKLERIHELEAKIAAIKASIPAAPDEALENRYWDHINRESFLGAYLQAVGVWSSVENPVMRYQQVGELLVKMYDSIQDLKLPDELMRNDTKFNQMLIQMVLFAEEVERRAETDSIDLPKQVHELSRFLDRFSDLLVEEGNKLFGIKRAMADEQRNEAVNWVTSAFDSARPVDERLEILSRLFDNQLIDTDDRLSFLEESIKLIRNGMKRPKPEPCPYDKLIKRHLSGIGRYIQKLEQDGRAIWCKRVAEEMFDSLEVWRKEAGMAAWTKEKFAEMLYLTAASVSTREQENGDIDYKLELFFLDREDSFSGHIINVSIQNEVVNEILLMG